MKRSQSGKADARVTRRPTWRLCLPLLITSMLIACSSVAPYSETAYQKALSLKQRTHEILAKAIATAPATTPDVDKREVLPYSTYQAEMEQVLVDIDAAYEYNRHRANNEVSTRQWDIMKDPDRELVGGFNREWKEGKVKHVALFKEMQAKLDAAFDTILDLEGGKLKPSDVGSN